MNLYVLDTARYWWFTDKSNAGRLAGDSAYTHSPAARDMFRYLANAPDGIVLENHYGHAYSDTGIYSAFANKPTLLGWPAHLITWHGPMDRVWLLNREIKSFYSGALDKPAQWLAAQNVRYIVWNSNDTRRSSAWQRINNGIKNHYSWMPFQKQGQAPVGIWVAKSTGF